MTLSELYCFFFNKLSLSDLLRLLSALETRSAVTLVN